MLSNHYVLGSKLLPVTITDLDRTHWDYVIVNPSLYYPFERTSRGVFLISTEYSVWRCGSFYDVKEGPTRYEVPSEEDALEKINQWAAQGGILVHRAYWPHRPDPEIYDYLRRIYGSETRTILSSVMSSDVARLTDKRLADIEREDFICGKNY